MTSKFNHPAFILAALAAVSGGLGTFALGVGTGEAPHPGLHMVLAGLWFGLVVGYGVWIWGSPTSENKSSDIKYWPAAAMALAGTWIGWEAAVNLALQLDSNWLKATAVPEGWRMFVSGFLAGGLGALVTWTGAACCTPRLRRLPMAAATTTVGALFGLLLPLTNNYDSPAVLLLPWQIAVAAVLGMSLARPQSYSGTPLSRLRFQLKAGENSHPAAGARNEVREAQQKKCTTSTTSTVSFTPKMSQSRKSLSKSARRFMSIQTQLWSGTIRCWPMPLPVKTR
jgi:HAMP domain-containing protein